MCEREKWKEREEQRQRDDERGKKRDGGTEKLIEKGTWRRRAREDRNGMGGKEGRKRRY